MTRLQRLWAFLKWCFSEPENQGPPHRLEPEHFDVMGTCGVCHKPWPCPSATKDPR